MKSNEAVNPAVVSREGKGKKKDEPAAPAAPATTEPGTEPAKPADEAAPPAAAEPDKPRRSRKPGSTSAPASFAALTLDDCRKVEIARGFGRHLAQAQKVAGEPDHVMLGLIVVLAKIDGKPVSMDEAMDMDVSDITAILGAIQGADVKTEPATTDADGLRSVPLPSGKRAVMVKAKGRHLIAAQRQAAGGGEVSMALIAATTTIDGKPIVLEDIMAMDLADVIKLQGEVAGGK